MHTKITGIFPKNRRAISLVYEGKLLGIEHFLTPVPTVLINQSILKGDYPYEEYLSQSR
jgi:hypothetical protein